jgi:hypothetical protein
MVEISSNLQGWTKSVYKFSCAFIHLSNFHDYQINDPFRLIENEEKNDIKNHLNAYHGFDLNKELTFESMVPYLFRVFEKTEENLVCYVNNLENNSLT